MEKVSESETGTYWWRDTRLVLGQQAIEEDEAMELGEDEGKFENGVPKYTAAYFEKRTMFIEETKNSYLFSHTPSYMNTFTIISNNSNTSLCAEQLSDLSWSWKSVFCYLVLFYYLTEDAYYC